MFEAQILLGVGGAQTRDRPLKALRNENVRAGKPLRKSRTPHGACFPRLGINLWQCQRCKGACGQIGILTDKWRLGCAVSGVANLIRVGRLKSLSDGPVLAPIELAAELFAFDDER